MNLARTLSPWLGVLLLAGAAGARPSLQWIQQQTDARRHAEAVLRSEPDASRRLLLAEALLCRYSKLATAHVAVLGLLTEAPAPAFEPLGLRLLSPEQAPDPRVRQAAARLLGAAGGVESRAALAHAAAHDPESAYNAGCYMVKANAREAATQALETLEARLGEAPEEGLLERAGSWLRGLSGGTPGPAPEAPDCQGLPALPPLPPEPPPAPRPEPSAEEEEEQARREAMERRTAATRRLFEDWGEGPTHEGNVLERWGILKDWILSRPPVIRRHLFTYGKLVRVRAELRQDPAAAHRQIDEMGARARQF